MELVDRSKYPIEDFGMLFSDAQALPNNTNADSTNTLDLLSNDSARQKALFIFIDLAFTNSNTVTVKVLQSEDDSTWETEYITLTVPAGTWAQRNCIGLIAPKRYIKLNYVDTEDLHTSTITAGIGGWDVR
jgi:hypothetical protein